MNLLTETKDVLKKIGKTEQDIEFVTDGKRIVLGKILLHSLKN